MAKHEGVPLWNQKELKINACYHVTKNANETSLPVSRVRKALDKAGSLVGVFRVTSDYMIDGSKPAIRTTQSSLEKHTVVILGEYVAKNENIPDNTYWLYQDSHGDSGVSMHPRGVCMFASELLEEAYFGVVDLPTVLQSP